MTIVIIDDSVASLVVLKQIAAKSQGLPVTAFSSSTAAALFLKGNAADLIVVDCEMPELNGIEFISIIRTYPMHDKTPILMVTQHAAEHIRGPAIHAGATDFLTKPVDALEFKVRLANLLHGRATAA